MLITLRKPLTTLALFIAAGLIWPGIGAPLIGSLQSGDPDTVRDYITVIGMMIFGILFVVQLAGSVRSLPGTPGDHPLVTDKSQSVEAAVALLGPRAVRRDVAAKASAIAEAWAGNAQLRFADSCRHEAAHAVTAHHFGGIILGASVSALGNGQLVWARPPAALTACNEHWMRLCIGIAGSVHDHSEGRHNAGSTMDTHQVLGDAVGLLATGERPDGFSRTLGIDNILAESRELVGKLLAEKEDELNAIAAELAVTGRLTGYQINSVLVSNLEVAETTS